MRGRVGRLLVLGLLMASGCGRVRYVRGAIIDAGMDARVLAADAAVDAGTDVGADAGPHDVCGPDAGVDAPARIDTGVDAGTDAHRPVRLWETLSPIGYYPFDGDGRDLANPIKSIACTDCVFRTGARLSGVTPRSTIALPDRHSSGDFAYAMWVYVPRIASLSTLFASEQSRVEADYSDTFSVAYLSVTTPADGGGGPSFSPDVWRQLTVNYVAATRTYSIFQDGFLEREIVATEADSLTAMQLAAVPGPASIDELFLFDRVLTESEITLLVSGL